MKVNQDKHSPLIPNLLLGMAGGLQYLRLKCASVNPRKSQEKTLRAILEYGKETVYGKEHKFSEILKAKDGTELFKLYQKYVNPSEYEDFRPYINRMKAGESDVLFQGRPLLYATTSGATGEPKWIPISKAYLNNIYGKMNKVWLFNFLKNRPKVYTGYIVSIVGKQIEGYTPDGTIFGSVSGFTQARCPGFVKKLYASPSEIFAIDDYTARNYAIMRMGIERNITLVVTANPSTMVELQSNVNKWWDEYITDIENGTMSSKVSISDDIRKAVEPYLKPNPERAAELRELKEKYGQVLPKHFWPNLQLLTTWKCGNTQIYLDKLHDCFPEEMLHQEFAYFASECRAGLVLDDSIETTLFPHMHYYEFKKASEFDNPDAPFHQLDELVEGEQYCPFVTTFSGLYRYNMNDIVQASSPFINTPRVHMIQKVNGIVTITGEKLYEGQFINAVNAAQESTDLKLNYFTGYANLPESRYDWYFEFADESVSQKQAEKFAAEVDNNLKKTNMEYESKRNSFRLKDPAVFRLESHSFEKFKATVVNETHQDASRFKPNILVQNETLHKIISEYIKPDVS
ncbi:MAG: GH3 auxin-responsive promoter family protein [Paludibacteraceae bacterium]|nr:GH3 auxin-responsive promoter family protein [Paludibacteraceae bacterium]